ncbi:MAG: hypothetical protein ACE5FH_05370 [Candidatus Zixiibacteriota bacterium]
MRNPLLVTELAPKAYLLLQDTAYFEQLVEAGILHIPSQICSLDWLAIRSPELGLSGFDFEALARFAKTHSEHAIQDQSAATDSADRQYLPIRFSFAERRCRLLLRLSNYCGCPGPLLDLFETIQACGRYQPVGDNEHTRHTVTRGIKWSGLMAMPPFTMTDLGAAAGSKNLFPADMIKVVSSVRALNLDFPFKALSSDMSLPDKAELMEELLAIRSQQSRTTFIEGRVFLLNR